jgi:hypothetical protein
MEGSGSNSNKIPVVSPQGEHTFTRIITSRDTVEIGGWTFKRRDLLFALGVNEKRTE